MRQPAFFADTFTAARFDTVLVYRDGDALEWARFDHGRGLVAVGLKVDVHTLHLLVEWDGEGVAQYGVEWADVDDILERDGCAYDDAQDVLGSLLSAAIDDGATDVAAEGATLTDLGETLVEVAR